jgi:hypothetical protein
MPSFPKQRPTQRHGEKHLAASKSPPERRENGENFVADGENSATTKYTSPPQNAESPKETAS